MLDHEKYIDRILGPDVNDLESTQEWPFIEKLRETDKTATAIRNRLRELERQQQQIATEARELESRLMHAAGACKALAEVLVELAKARQSQT